MTVDYEFEAPVKDPQSVLKHSMNWSDWLDAGETISTQTVVSSEPGVLVVDQVTQNSGVVNWRVAGGADGGRYRVTCTVTTNQGRTDERTVYYKIGQR